MSPARIRPATREDVTMLESLLELYMHDLSEAFAIEVGPGGRFGYEALPRYFDEPDRRFPFLIERDGRVVGFALVTRGSPVTDDPSDLDVAEFFVLRRHRRGGTGRAAAFQLWDRMPGRWIVRVSMANAPALPFWKAVIQEYTGGELEERRLSRKGSDWLVFEFRSREGVAKRPSRVTPTERALTIRACRAGDSVAIATLWRRVFHDHSRWRGPEAVIGRRLRRQRELFLVGLLDGQLVGTTLAGYDGHRGWIYRVAVSPEHRGRGFGSALMREAEKRLARLGCPKINLQIEGDNRDVAGFYAGLGYAVEDRVSMGKPVTPSSAPRARRGRP